MSSRSLRSLLLLPLTALALASCGGAPGEEGVKGDALPKVSAPAAKKWSETVVTTPDGGLLVGNPEAPIKVVEFASLTCHVCAEFSKESEEELARDFIDTGRVSFETRQFLRNSIDLMAASTIACAPLERQPALIANVMASQEELFAGANAGGAAAEAALKNTADPARFAKAAEALGISAMFQSRGMAADQINSCLSNTAAIDKLVADNNKWNEDFTISGTPTIVVNGQVATGITAWTALRDRLQTMGAR